jgi:hypothetical protein
VITVTVAEAVSRIENAVMAVAPGDVAVFDRAQAGGPLYRSAAVTVGERGRRNSREQRERQGDCRYKFSHDASLHNQSVFVLPIRIRLRGSNPFIVENFFFGETSCVSY